MSEVCAEAGRAVEEMKNQETRKEIAHKMGIYEKYIKRPQDFLCALAAIIVLSPVMLITALLVKVKLGSPVIFTQDRPGLGGKIFKLYKFRSMTDARDENGDLLPDEVRLTSFGKKLRSTSLDGKVIIRQTLKNLEFARVSPFCPTGIFPQIASF